MEGTVRKHVYVSGRVQGVGFRYYATYIAQRNGVSGWVKNLYDGRVEMEVQGKPEQIDALFEGLKRQRHIQITDLEMKDIPADPSSYEMKVRY
ncbi:MAG: acylphosphatase [Lachnospiraceae bacterium]|nr:acylphosphatase [Lachnospiraceae bacterium]